MKKAYFYGGIAILFWSTIAAITKLMLGDLSSMHILSATMLLASISLFFANLWRGNLHHFRAYKFRDYLYMFFLGAIGLFLYKLLL